MDATAVLKDLAGAAEAALKEAPEDRTKAGAVAGWMGGAVKPFLDRLWASPFAGFVFPTKENVSWSFPVADHGFWFCGRPPEGPWEYRTTAQWLQAWQRPEAYRRILVALWLCSSAREPEGAYDRTGDLLRRQVSENPSAVVGMAEGAISWLRDELPFVANVAASARKVGLDVNQRLIMTFVRAALEKRRADLAEAPNDVSPAKWFPIENLVKAVEMAKDKDEKGQALEKLLATLFETIPGFSVKTRVRTATEEIDITIVNNSDDSRLKRESALILAECKNWSRKCGKNEFVAFQRKVLNRRQRCSLGFLISWNGFAKTVKMEMLRSSNEKACVAILDGTAIREAVSKRSFLPVLLSAWDAVVNL